MRPPRIARWVLSRLAADRDRRVIVNDLDEEFAHRLSIRQPPLGVRAWYWRQVMLSAPTLLRHRAGHWASDAVGDARFGARMLWRQPIFTVAAIASLALGIGAATGVFSVVNALMLRPLPVVRPDELVSFTLSQRGRSTDHEPYPVFDAFRQAGFVSQIAATAVTGRVNVYPEGRAADASGVVAVELVSGSYFPTLGVGAEAGRTIEPNDDNRDAAPVAVLSDAYWRRAFNADPSAVGRAVVISGLRYAVVGVADSRFPGEDVGGAIDVWVPIAHQSAVMTERPGLLTHPTSNWVRMIARVPRGVSRSLIVAAATTVFERTVPESSREGVTVALIPAGRGFSRGAEFLATPMLVLMAVVAVVLLIACANVAMLIVARASARTREMTVRLALGASRGRLLRQLLAENVTLAGVAGLLGAMIAVWGASAAARSIQAGRLGLALDTRLDTRVFLVSIAFTFGTLLLVGLLPAFSVLRGQRAGGSSGRTGRVLIVAQLALSLALMVTAGLLGRTLHNLQAQDVGFDRESAWLFWMAPGEAGQQGAALVPAFSEAVSAVSSVPGVSRASVSTDGVLSGFIGLRAVHAEGAEVTAEADINAEWNLVGPGFFDTIGMRLSSGRDFQSSDAASAPPVAVVNEAMARYFFGTTDVLGRRFSFGRDPLQRISIVGVVKNAKYFSARDQDVRMVFLPYAQDASHLFRMCVVARIDGPPADVISRIRQTLRSTLPAVPLLRVESTGDQFDQALSVERLTAWLGGGFGALAMALASVGLYGVAAFAVSRRTREIGIRMALGATRAAVLRRELGQSAALIALGLLAGLPLTWFAGRSVGALLFGVTAVDPWTTAGAVAVLAGLSLAAGIIPARRACRVDPIVTLRVEDTSGGSHA